MRADKPLAVTMGDPAGIGPEIILEAWSVREAERLAPFVAVGRPEWLLDAARRRPRAVPIDTITATEALADPRALGLAARDPNRLVVVAVGDPGPAVVPGRPTEAAAPAIIAAIETSVALIAAGQAAGIVTAPIAKAVLKSAGFAHPGHTELLGELSRRHWPVEPCQPVMMLVGADLRVVPVTVHVPLTAVAPSLTGELIMSVARITARALTRDFAVARPRIAVCGLNPHAGENATMGTEERDIIAPAVAGLVREGLEVRGPLPADTLFHPRARRNYDAVLGMYHDQVLIPLKTIAFESGVNTTLGLAFVRTSPDHGTAFDIAGTGTADPTSMIAAIRLAGDMVRRRDAAPVARVN